MALVSSREWLTKTPTLLAPGVAIIRPWDGPMDLGLSGWKMKPQKSAPNMAAKVASWGLVRPQILTMGLDKLGMGLNQKN